MTRTPHPLRLFVIILLHCLQPGSPLRAEEVRVEKLEHFSLDLPAGCTIQKLPSPSDFDLYSVTRNEVKLVGVYVGNAAHFPTLTATAPQEAVRLDAGLVTMVTLWAGTVLLRREILVKTGITQGWPHAVHVWTAELPAEQVPLAERILASLKVIPKP